MVVLVSAEAVPLFTALPALGRVQCGRALA
jgi:hypothetical protein